MGEQTNLGRIGFILHSEWDSEKTYKFLDVVPHNEELWGCIVEETTQEPGEGDDWKKLITSAAIVHGNDSHDPEFTLKADFDDHVGPLGEHNIATEEENGFMYKDDKAKLNAIEEEANNYSLETHGNDYHIEDYLSELPEHGDIYHTEDYAKTNELFSGSYLDLEDVPNEFTPETHGSDKHSVDYLTEMEEHGDVYHTEDYAKDTDLTDHKSNNAPGPHNTGDAATYDVGEEDDELPTNQIVDDKIDDIDAGIPAGVICMWSGSISSVPTGWALCDGADGTPDLRDRFVIGAGGDRSVDETSDGQMPEHTHGSGSLSTGSTGSHGHDITTWSRNDDRHEHEEGDEPAGRPPTYGPDGTNTSAIHSAGSHSHSISGSVSSAGSGSEVIAKYYALAYIMKL